MDEVCVKRGTKCAYSRCNYIFKDGDYALRDENNRFFHCTNCKNWQEYEEGKPPNYLKTTWCRIRIE
ncbi:MAG: hypothetical protein J7K72_03335 [Candidatus Aenigmarchaeota archaeon]|nr:hypothetical protein [Candidatus Aenigmarchaeota archaeon]